MDYSTTAAGTTSVVFGVLSGLVSLAVYIVIVIGMWKTFRKAGHPGWLAIIPIVNAIYLLKIGQLSGWFVLLYLVPIANVVLTIILAVRVGENFGKDGVFSVFLLWLFAPIGYCIVGFGQAEYRPLPR